MFILRIPLSKLSKNFGAISTQLHRNNRQNQEVQYRLSNDLSNSVQESRKRIKTQWPVMNLIARFISVHSSSDVVLLIARPIWERKSGWRRLSATIDSSWKVVTECPLTLIVRALLCYLSLCWSMVFGVCPIANYSYHAIIDYIYQIWIRITNSGSVMSFINRDEDEKRARSMNCWLNANSSVTFA